MKLFYVKTLIFALLISASPKSLAEAKFNSDELCNAIKKEKEPVAILLDENGKISKGPINFGRVGYKYSEKEFFTIPTKHFIALSPARLKFGTCHIGCLELIPVANACKDAKIYAVNYLVLDKESFNTDRSWLPWKEDAQVKIEQLDDPKSDYSPPLNYRFETRIVGEVYDATNRK